MIHHHSSSIWNDLLLIFLCFVFKNFFQFSLIRASDMNISMEDIILRFLSLKFKSNFPKYWNNFRWWIMNIISYLYTYIYTYLRSIACEVLRKIEKMCNKKCGLLQLKIFISVALILWRKKCNLSILHYFSHFSAPLYIGGTVWTTYIK